MQHRRRSTTVLALALGASSVVAACGDDDDDAGSATTAAAATTAAGGATDDGRRRRRRRGRRPDGRLPGHRRHPDRLDPRGRARLPLPDRRRGHMIDTGRRSSPVRCSTAPAHDTGVDIEIRSGGPAHRLPDRHVADLYQDEDILLGYVYTDEAIQNSGNFPTVAIESGYGEEPADDHVGSGDVPGRRRASPTSARQGQDPLLRRRGVHGLLRPERRASAGSGRRQLHGRPATVRRRRGQAGAAGLRLGRAVQLRERDRRMEASRSRTSTSTTPAGRTTPSRSRRSPRTSRRTRTASAALVPIIQQASVDFLDRSGARRTRSSSTPSGSSTRLRVDTPRASPTTPSRR